MNKPIKKISLILFLIILLPIMFFTIREFVSLDENETILEQIYRNQLESILFSVNQYSEDVVRNWSFEIGAAYNVKGLKDEGFEKWLNGFLDQNSSLKSIFISDSSLQKIIAFSFINKKVVPGDIDTISAILKKNKPSIERLFRYESGGFNKIEPVKSASINDNQRLFFVLDNNSFCGLEIDPKRFVEQNLISKIQSVAREEFKVSVFDSTSSKILYTTSQTPIKSEQSKHLWLFPNYSLGIQLTGVTIEELVKNRSQTNLILIACLAVLLIAAALFGFRNIKKEVELAQIKSDFVSNVSHELRTPLALINMFAETLALGRVKNDEKRNEYYNIIQHETERLSKIVNKILSFSKMEAGQWKYNFTTGNLNSVVDKIYDNYKFHLQNKGFEFLYEKKDDLPNCSIDTEAVSEAVINLIDNSVKYSIDNKKIILRTGKGSNNIFIEVEDHGLGISKEDQKKIFDKFYRIITGNVHNVKGTGLGLTLVKHIIDAHKGEITLTSEIGKGSIFRLTFPV